MARVAAARTWPAFVIALLLAFGFAADDAWARRGEEPGAPRLALMPLPLSAFGPSAPSLRLAADSGVVSNGEAASEANESVTAALFAHLGRLSGYTLDYGSALSGGKGILQLETTVERYRSAAAARDGLAFWRRDDTDLAALKALGVSVSIVLTRPVGVGVDSFGDVGDLHLRGRPVIYGADVEFQDGNLVGQVTVSAGRAGVSQPLALLAARRLRTRIAGVLSGAITSAPVSLPAVQPKPGSGGVDLASLALTPGDVGNASVKHQGYAAGGDLDAESAYERELMLPGFVVDEEIDLFSSVSSAGFAYSILSGISSSGRYWQQEGRLYGVSTYAPHPVTVHAGDQSVAVLGLARVADGRSGYLGFISLRTGRTTEFITVASAGGLPLTASALAAIAAAAASRAERLDQPGFTA